MMNRLRDGLLNLWEELSCRFRRPRAVCERRVDAGALRGTSHRVIIVRPENGMFREAVFILRDDYFQTPGLSPQELLREAKNAAEEYITANASYTRGKPNLLPAMTIFALTALALLTLRLTGII